MNVEYEIQTLKEEIEYLRDAFIQAQKNQAPITNKVDATSNKVDDTANKLVAITPYTETKTAYYGETEKTFYDVPDGNVSVYFTDYDGDYSVSRVSGRLTISFDTLTEQTDITISIQ